MKKILTILGLVFTLLLSTAVISCGSDLVAPKYEDEEDPDKPVGGEEPKWRNYKMETFGIIGFVFGLGALVKIIMLEEKLKGLGVLKEKAESGKN